MNSSISVFKWFLLILFFTISSCKESPETIYDKNGVYFISPKGWEITQDIKSDYGLRFIAIEKDGVVSTGQINIFIDNSDAELSYQLKWIENIVKESKLFDFTKVRFGESIYTKYKNYSALSSKFNMITWDLNMEGIIYCFDEKEKLICVLYQGAVEDREINALGLKIFEDSFEVK